jgi:dTDP-4-amino-4,6-dideoxygalactose transaminase
MNKHSNKNSEIYVTKPFLPPIEEFNKYLKEIWTTKYLTNGGKFHSKLEKMLAEYLGVPYVSLFVNGTLALIIALKALNIKGEVITTPFSFPATTHTLRWNEIIPVFCDIEPDYLTIDPKRIESAITSKTTAILPVHIYGNPCEIKEIKKIADRYKLKVIYDAAHSFGVKVNSRSVLNYGDLSVLSFHATKVFTTFEGGAIVCRSKSMKKNIDYLKNFGFAGETTVVCPGINAKMNEFQAAVGVLQMKYYNKSRIRRKVIAERYRSELREVKGISCLRNPDGVQPNYSYFLYL